MTIFQKIILVPILSLILYGSFITYSYFEQQESTQKIIALRDDYAPILQIVNENIGLFDKLRDAFKDAVLASELIWLTDTLTIKKQIEANLSLIEKRPHIIEKAKVLQVRKDLQLYYISAKELAEKLLIENGEWSVDEKSIQDVESYLNISSQHFVNLRRDTQQAFSQTLNETNKLQSDLLFWGGIISVSSMLLLVIVTFTISLTTRRSMYLIIKRTKELALGSTDFSQRLERTNKDELAELVYWYNKLSDKLEDDYIQLKTISITDKLTQLNNRTRTDQFLPAALAESQLKSTPLILVVLDIDHFKQVNDTYGHLAGDTVLQYFANALKKSAKEPDYISRWGGEEFLLVWSNIDPDSAYIKAEQLREKIQAIDFPEVGKVTASIGLALAEKNDTPQTLISRADNNLYKAKELGRNCVVLNSRNTN